MSTQETENIVGKVVCRANPKVEQEGKVETLEFKIHNFEGLEQKFGKFFETPELIAHGHRWCLHIYPRGADDGDRVDEDVVVFLRHVGRGQVKVRYNFHPSNLEQRNYD